MPKSPSGKQIKAESQVLHLGIVACELEKKSSYWEIPKTLVKNHPPASKSQQWFDYAHGNYYPIGLMNQAGDLVQTKRSVQLEVSYINDLYAPIEPSIIGPVKAKSGIYWFTALKSYVFGKIVVNFSVVPDETDEDNNENFISYNEHIVITKDEDGNENSDNLMECVDEDEPIDKKKMKKGKYRHEVNEDEGEPNQTRKTKKSNKRSESFASNDDNNESSVILVKKKSKKNSKCFSDVFLPDIIMPEPVVAPNAARYRLYRSPFCDSDSGKSERIVIAGGALSITLPQSLTLAALDDETRVKTNAILHSEGRLSTLDEPHTLYYNRPTSNQLFLKLANRMSHVVDAADIVNQLRLLFEYCFEDWILYAEEKDLLKSKLSQIKSDKLKFGDHFGPYYYLRFIMFFILLADTVTSEGDNGGSSRGNDRQFKTLFSKAQEVVNNAVKDMDESAPKYFA